MTPPKLPAKPSKSLHPSTAEEEDEMIRQAIIASLEECSGESSKLPDISDPFSLGDPPKPPPRKQRSSSPPRRMPRSISPASEVGTGYTPPPIIRLPDNITIDDVSRSADPYFNMKIETHVLQAGSDLLWSTRINFNPKTAKGPFHIIQILEANKGEPYYVWHRWEGDPDLLKLISPPDSRGRRTPTGDVLLDIGCLSRCTVHKDMTKAMQEFRQDFLCTTGLSFPLSAKTFDKQGNEIDEPEQRWAGMEAAKDPEIRSFIDEISQPSLFAPTLASCGLDFSKKPLSELSPYHFSAAFSVLGDIVQVLRDSGVQVQSVLAGTGNPSFFPLPENAEVAATAKRSGYSVSYDHSAATVKKMPRKKDEDEDEDEEEEEEEEEAEKGDDFSVYLDLDELNTAKKVKAMAEEEKNALEWNLPSLKELCDEYNSILPFVRGKELRMPLSAAQVSEHLQRIVPISSAIDGFRRINAPPLYKEPRAGAILRSLNTVLERLHGGDREYDLILRWLTNTSRTHGSSVAAILRVTRPDEEVRFRQWAKRENRYLLWHGSSVQYLLSILATGLKSGQALSKPRTTVSSNHYGIFFADQAQTSLGYVHGGQYATLLVCEVAMGRIEVEGNPWGFEPSPGYDSVLVNARGAILNEGCQEFEEGLKIPIGTPGYPCSNSEFVVFNPSQVRIRYVVRIKH